jgi:DedD protein
LVIFVVLVVPIFLDGPPDDGERVSQRVLLPGQEEQDTKTVVLNRERTEPIPVANQQASKESEPQPVPVAEKQRAAPDPVVEPVKVAEAPKAEPQTRQEESAASASTTGMWAVQLGSFSSKENAEKLAADLRKQGYAAFLSQLQTSSGPLHRVRIGPQKDRESAEQMAARLAKVNHKGQVVPHP